MYNTNHELAAMTAAKNKAVEALKLARSKMHRCDFPQYGVDFDKMIAELEEVKI